MPTQENDADLLTRISTDASALEELYRRHVGIITGYAVRRCDQPADVVDLVAATFLAVLESAHTYKPHKGEALPWIIGIASRLHSNKMRRRFREFRAINRIGLRVDLTPDDIEAIEERIDSERQSPQLTYALSQLREPYREALRLVAYDGLTQTEAAQALQISPTTLRKRLSRARAAIKSELGDEPIRLSAARATGEVTR
ncbi:MAG TPA: RNA polymerase sigma factor [Actinomycetota bacterium]|nr:RNA polymerase sigma factor [Actinomycetota bacterium]